MWAWLQERRAPGTATTYAGCLTLPRVLTPSPDGRRLLQQPATELATLRRCYSSHAGADGPLVAASAGAGGQSDVAPGFSARGGWYAEAVEVAEAAPLAVEGVAAGQLDIELCLSRWAACRAGLEERQLHSGLVVCCQCC